MSSTIIRFAVLSASLAFMSCGNGTNDTDAGDAGDAGFDADVGRSPGMVGDSCLTDEDCVVTAPFGQVVCLRAAWGFREGYCAIANTSDESQCQAGDTSSTHVEFPCSQSMCVYRCESSEDCREGYECFLGYQACWPRCEPGRACPFPPPRLCEIDEDCDDGDACTTDGCIDGVCAYDRINFQPRRAARIATLGSVVDVDFTGRIENNNLRLVVAEGEDGVEVFDLSNPTEPRVYFRIEPSGPALSVLLQRGGIWVAAGDQGVESFDDGSGAALSSDLIEEGEASAMGLSVRNNRSIHVSSYRHGLFTMDTDSRTLDPEPCDTRGRAVDAAYVTSPDVAYVADSLAGLAVCSYEEGTNYNTQIQQVDTLGRMLAVSAQNEVLVAAEAGAGFGVFDITVSTLPIRQGEVEVVDGNVLDVQLLGTRTLAVAASEGGLLMYSLEDCFEPVLWFEWETDGPATSLDYTDGVVVIGLGEAGIELLDIGCRAPPEDEIEE